VVELKLQLGGRRAETEQCNNSGDEEYGREDEGVLGNITAA
jgi:hypothetical protein